MLTTARVSGNETSRVGSFFWHDTRGCAGREGVRGVVSVVAGRRAKWPDLMDQDVMDRCG
jgi:hypothetical protein